ncbi:dynein light chain Tctex-type protein 2B-like [Aricia agestis]|uniref:dynein light chain Tctex-type protein 2B-like n=1 Tax=Aricia agestis TaxID=91739 RepID=UPI001C20AE76|nr:dynein light chain Tctex-type protein 2B-like [Aricia agestis]
MADEEVVEEEPDIVHVGSGESESGLSPIEPAKPIAPTKYDVRPSLGEKFQKENVWEIIVLTMSEQLSGRQYRADEAPKWAKSISNAVRQRVQELDMKRYKILVQTTIVEMKGAGIKSVQRCIWDPETDSYADDLYRNDSICCYTVVYGTYMY